MRYITGILVLLFFVSFSFGVQSLKVKSDNTTIYSSKSSDKSKGVLAKGAHLSLLRKSKDRSFVKTTTGLKGWVQNSSVEYVKGSKGDTYNLSEQEVHGWLDNPSAVYILDNSGLNTEALPLNRRFDDEVFELQDREALERGNDEN